MNDPTTGYLRVLRQRCSTCIFRPGNPMHLRPGRLAEMVAATWEDDSAVICHSTLDPATPTDVVRGPQAVCRGSFDRLDTTPVQVAKRLGMVRFVDEEETG